MSSYLSLSFSKSVTFTHTRTSFLNKNTSTTHFFLSMLGPSTSETPLLIAPTAAPRYMMSSNPVGQSQQRFGTNTWNQTHG